jgi:hypothetical protein
MSSSAATTKEIHRLSYIGQFVCDIDDEETISIPIKYHLSTKQAEQFVYNDGAYNLSPKPLILKNDIYTSCLKLSITFVTDDIKCKEYDKFISEPNKIVMDGIKGHPINGYDTLIYSIREAEECNPQIILAVKAKHTDKCVGTTCYCEPLKYEPLDVYFDESGKPIVNP